jgi:hypothetical protein
MSQGSKAAKSRSVRRLQRHEPLLDAVHAHWKRVFGVSICTFVLVKQVKASKESKESTPRWQANPPVSLLLFLSFKLPALWPLSFKLPAPWPAACFTSCFPSCFTCCSISWCTTRRGAAAASERTCRIFHSPPASCAHSWAASSCVRLCTLVLELRQHLYFCASSCISICTLVLAAASVFVLLY